MCMSPRQFHTLPGLLDSWAALPNSNPKACVPMQGGSLYHFYDGLWYDPAEWRTHDLPCERRTCYRLNQPDTVPTIKQCQCHGCKIFLPQMKILTPDWTQLDRPPGTPDTDDQSHDGVVHNNSAGIYHN